MKIRTVVIVVLMTTLGAAYGCDCKPTSNVKDGVRESHLVVTGKILHAYYGMELDQSQGYLDTLGKQNERLYSGPVRVNEYVILVLEAFKGASIGDTVLVRTALDPVTDCGLRLTVCHHRQSRRRVF